MLRCGSPPIPSTRPTGRCCRRHRSARTAIETTLLFFELEWAALSEERAEELLAGEGLDFCRHYLRNLRRYRDHLLSEPEEKILSEKALTGAGAWTRLFEELTSAIEVSVPGGDVPARRWGAGEKVALDVALSRLALPDREVRRATAEAVTAALAPGCARGRSCSTRCSRTRRPTTACAATPTGWRRATSQTRPATSPCRR